MTEITLQNLNAIHRNFLQGIQEFLAFVQASPYFAFLCIRTPMMSILTYTVIQKGNVCLALELYEIYAIAEPDISL